jgi:hypothetical protein
MKKKIYETVITPMVDIQVKTKWLGRTVERTWFKGSDYIVCKLKGDPYISTCELWDGQGLIGVYSIPTTELVKCMIEKYQDTCENEIFDVSLTH